MVLLRSILVLSLAATFGFSSPRIVSGSPEVTELLFQLGKGGSIVGTPAFSDYPEAAKAIPSIGSASALSLEATLKRRPDWVILEDSSDNQPFGNSVRRFGIKTFRLDINSVDDLFSESKRLLQTVFQDTQNAELAAFLKLWKKGRTAVDTGLILAWYDPVILFGRHTFLSDLLSYRSARNIAKVDWKLSYPQVSPEWLMVQKPDKVFLLCDGMIPEEFRAKAAKIWKHSPELVPLPWSKYARASFTPFLEEMR